MALQTQALLKEGDAHMAAGEKACKTSWLRWQPDLDTAAVEFEKAAACYKSGKAMQRSVEAYRKAADAKYRTRQPFVAAKQLEHAAQAAKSYDPRLAAQLFSEAAGMFSETGNSEKTAASLTSAAKVVENTDVELAVDYYQRAADMYEIDDKESYGMDTYRALIGLAMREKRLDLATNALKKQLEAYNKHKRWHESYKCELGLIVLLLAQDDYVGADRHYQASLGAYETYVRSDEGKAAGRLLDAYETHDAENLQTVTKLQTFEFLHPHLLRLARNLRVPGDSAPAPQKTAPVTTTPVTTDLSDVSSALDSATAAFSSAAAAAASGDTVPGASEFSAFPSSSSSSSGAHASSSSSSSSAAAAAAAASEPSNDSVASSAAGAAVPPPLESTTVAAVSDAPPALTDTLPDDEQGSLC